MLLLHEVERPVQGFAFSQRAIKVIRLLGRLLAGDVQVAGRHVRDGRHFHRKQQRVARGEHHQLCTRVHQQRRERGRGIISASGTG